MTKNVLRIENSDARRLWLHAQGLASAPTGPLDLLGIIERLGFVQLDTIRVVARAHHHILWSRNQHYREPMLNKLLMKKRAVFEHFTHDASVLPMATYPLWRRQFTRMEAKLRRSGWYKSMLDDDGRAGILARIEREGPLSTHAFDTVCKDKSVAWRRPPHKQALDFMWYAGELSTSHRQNFIKFYDLTERVIPEAIREDERSDDEQVDWLCHQALDRLAFASEGEIQRFWEAADLPEVKRWSEAVRRQLPIVEVESAAGDWLPALAPPDIEERLQTLPPPTSRLRIINPFDPVVRDRNRLKRLFGFDYRIEIFVPAANRRFGYYVFPLLEGDRFVGRIEVRADRPSGVLTVVNLWLEPGVKLGAGRQDKLDAELKRLCRFIGLGDLIWTGQPPDQTKIDPVVSPSLTV
ncbi:MAG: winged helix DNA-binding domain-containing protein [Alphaproteobacteria bacterium]|nr:winged helix DNA-binding domain-containing protein [Alphaproteobacteria bacterium]